MTRPIFMVLGSFSALIGVGMGAFGAHGLKAVISPEMLAVYQTGVNYQMWHALGLLAVGIIQHQTPDRMLISWAGWFMFAGIVIFSGSLYLLAILNLRWLGMITPIGGACFLLAWLLLSISLTRKKSTGRYH
jgi:uncharacterized membrane protein YgdD (TMEM256/DUF423 family)